MGFPFSDSPAYQESKAPIGHLHIDLDQILAFCRVTMCYVVYVAPDRLTYETLAICRTLALTRG
jgi:hypothetical protein